MKPELSIIIPCYNEAQNLEILISKLNQLPKEPLTEIILVDNGSKDGSFIKMCELLNSNSENRIKPVQVLVNEGYGYGILEGLKYASAPVLAWTHADLQTDPKDVISAYQLWLKSKNEQIVIKGKRINRSFLPAFFSKGMEWIASLALGVKLTEINAQPKLFSKSFYLNYIENQGPKDFSLDLFLLVKAAQNGDILEIPVDFASRTAGEAKGGGGSWKNRWKLIKRTYTYIFELRNREKHFS